ncbi:MAG: O-antigen ligase family protein [Pseudomonadota bacterium]
MGFFITCLYVAFIFLRPQEFIEDIKGWPIIEYMAYISLIVVFLEGDFKAEVLKRTPTNALVLAFWLAMPFSNIANFWFGGVSYAFIEMAKVAIVYFLIVLTIDSWGKLKFFLWLLVICSTFLAVQAIVQFHTGVGLVGGHALLRDGELLQARGIGIFADPNDLALNIVPMVAFVLPSFHKRFLSKTWLTGILFLIPMVVGITYTHSRGGMLALAAVGWYYLRRRVGRVASIAGVVLILAAMMAMPRMGEINAQEESAHTRLEHWGYGLDQFKSHPLFGVGFSMFTNDYPQTAHNSFVLVFTEAGLLGAVIWVAMFFSSFRDLRLIRKEWRGPPYLNEAADSMFAALMGWLVAAFFLSQTYKPLSFILMALVVASQNALAKEGVTLAHPWRAKEYIFCLGIAMSSIVILNLLIMAAW